MNYINKFKGQNENGRRSTYDILSLDPQNAEHWKAIKEEYRAVDIDKVIIDGDTFTNYGAFQFTWEKSYVKSPTRSSNGAIDNLNSYATFVTPHLIINFSLMSIDDYRAIMRKDLEKNEFVVECYDPIYNQWTVNKMYLGTAEMAKLHLINRKRFNGLEWEEFMEIVGVEGYTIDLIGTNNDLDFLSVVYHLNPPADTGFADQTISDDEIYSGQDVIIGEVANSFTNQTFNGKYKFSKWNIDGSNPTTPKDNGNYINGEVYTINRGADIPNNKTALVLYALWNATTDYTLSFSYGLADPAINESTYTYETSRKVVKGKSIGTLPIAETPTVKHNNLNGVEQTYTPYYNGKWYKTPIKAVNSVAVVDNELYWLDRDSAIYLIYDVMSYKLNLYLDGKLYQSNSVEYNTAMNLPQLVKSGKVFDGWYSAADFKKGTQVSGLMPPYNLTLYARWLDE